MSAVRGSTGRRSSTMTQTDRPISPTSNRHRDGSTVYSYVLITNFSPNFAPCIINLIINRVFLHPNEPLHRTLRFRRFTAPRAVWHDLDRRGPASNTGSGLPCWSACWMPEQDGWAKCKNITITTSKGVIP